jgi:hypothetical protein
LWRRPRPKLGCGAKERRREEYSLKVFENRVLRIKFGLCRMAIKKLWKKLRYEEL